MKQTSNRSVVAVRDLCKKYKGSPALSNISFEVEDGELFGFIGPDGGGKTSLFRILTSLLLPDSGSAEVLGLDVVTQFRELRQRIGYMPGRFSLYSDLSVEENLEFFATVFNTTVNENYHLIKDIYSHIEPFKKRRAGQLSGGMKQKLALSCALIHKPEVLFLDEPTTGVDAVSRKEFWEMLKNLQSVGITIVVSTPYMDEAVLCDRVALIQTGQILRIDTPESIVSSFDSPLFAVKAKETFRLIQVLQQYQHTLRVYPFGEYIHYTDNRGQIDREEFVNYLNSKNVSLIELHHVRPQIEDCFISLMEKNV